MERQDKCVPFEYILILLSQEAWMQKIKPKLETWEFNKVQPGYSRCRSLTWLMYPKERKSIRTAKCKPCQTKLQNLRYINNKLMYSLGRQHQNAYSILSFHNLFKSICLLLSLVRKTKWTFLFLFWLRYDWNRILTSRTFSLQVFKIWKWKWEPQYLVDLMV